MISTLVTLYGAAFLFYLGFMGRFTATAGVKHFSQQHEGMLRLVGLVWVMIATVQCAYVYGWERGTPAALFIFALAGLTVLAVTAYSFKWGFWSAVIAWASTPLLIGLATLS